MEKKLLEIMLSSVRGRDIYIVSDMDCVVLAWARNNIGILVCFRICYIENDTRI
jgi:hypothetical protein